VVISSSLDGGTLSALVSRDSDLDDGEFMRARGHSSVVGPGIIGTVAALGTVAAGVAIVEAALIPGLLIGAAAVLVPRLLPRNVLSGEGSRLPRAAPSAVLVSAPRVQATQAVGSNELASFDTWRVVVKTFTYRVMVTTVDFGANYFVTGELATAAGLSTLSLVAGPIAYFTHEAAWHFYGPVSARLADPLKASVYVPIPGTRKIEEGGPAGFGGVKVSRALAKTVTYEVVTAVSEFGANYLFVRDLVAAAGLTTFSLVIAPFVYYVHEKAWDHYHANQARSPVLPAPVY
jgi:uncharacterized membrane protein